MLINKHIDYIYLNICKPANFEKSLMSDQSKWQCRKLCSVFLDCVTRDDVVDCVVVFVTVLQVMI